MPAVIGDVDSPPPSVEVVRTKTAELWLGEDGILRVRCLPGSVHTIKEARENVNALRHRLMKKVPCLIDIRSVAAVTREAREFFRGPENDSYSAAALLISSPLSVAIASFFSFVGASKTSIAHRVF